MKDWVQIIIGLLVLGITLFLLGKYSPLQMLNWFTAIIGIVVGTAALMYTCVNWGKYLGHTL
ncbi:hypothetical protein [Acetilactobacillus jinshanensis]|uniref:Uncharacterized protein n=1 Tax=Acetilactobacillus jinshanensis TaxID=1720083 RepID=A0A4P6ZL63_9LACO|nr:hypothetical protein [Acetilactobacillus jinshanensis]QBP18303.1 hypothetical protein ELX58_03945 [Acetilactobacillus jinshanensis]URL61168.1 hypothetical protein HGK75_04010 [uncultured bacterium]